MQFKVTLPELSGSGSKLTLKVGWGQESASKEVSAKDKSITVDVPDGQAFALSLYEGDGPPVRQAFNSDGTPLGKGGFSVKATRGGSAPVEKLEAANAGN